MSAELLTPVPVMKIGRKRTTHLARVLIEGEPPRVVIRTRCGIRHDDTFTETVGFPTCDACIEAIS